MKIIEVFDSTLRDGEQAPGFSMNLHEKLTMARMLEELGVSVIEAGFAACSQGDFACVKAVSEEIKTCYVSSLCRCNLNDIDTAWNALSQAKKPLLNVFIATSDLHLEYKLKITREECIEKVQEAVAYAKSKGCEVEFSAEDATRSDREFLRTVMQTALNAGADVVNIADTVGYFQPEETAELVTYLKQNLKSQRPYKLSVHCHNDLGLATANTLAAIKAGVDRVDLTINGIGERAGNASLEETVMALKTRPELYGADTNIVTNLLVPTSRRLEMLTGVKVQLNKAIVGKNAFLHEAGIHQHGVMQKRETYELIKPEEVGFSDNKIILGKHSGKHALEEKLATLGYRNLTKEQTEKLFEEFKILAETKKIVHDKDIEALVKELCLGVSQKYTIDKYVINSGNVLSNTCNIRIAVRGGEMLDGFATGEGPIDACYNAINVAVKLDLKLLDYSIESVTGGTDAQGAVSVKVLCNDRILKGFGVDVNIFEASIKAYLNALNSIEA